MRVLLVLAAVLTACETSVPAEQASTARPDSGFPAPVVDEASNLEARAVVSGLAGDWRLAGDALARSDRRPQAVSAYEACAKAASNDFETALYCQAAAAVVRKVKARRTP